MNPVPGIILAAKSENVPSNAQSDQNLHWAHFGLPMMLGFFMRKKTSLVRLRGCAG